MPRGLAQTPAETGLVGPSGGPGRGQTEGSDDLMLCWRCPWDRCSDTPHPVRTTTLHGSPGSQRHMHIHVLSLPSQPSLTMSVISHRKMGIKQTHTHTMQYMWMHEKICLNTHHANMMCMQRRTHTLANTILVDVILCATRTWRDTYWFYVHSPGEMVAAVRNHLIILAYAEYQINRHGNYRRDLRVEDMLKAGRYILSMETIILLFQLGKCWGKMLHVCNLFFCNFIYFSCSYA